MKSNSIQVNKNYKTKLPNVLIIFQKLKNKIKNKIFHIYMDIGSIRCTKKTESIKLSQIQAQSQKNNKKLKKYNRETPIIVSLTSFPARFEKLHLCIKTLLMQSLKPDKIILYLGTDCDVSVLPQSLTELKQYGLEIKTGYEDLKPHKKYFYAMQEYPDAIIITVDDDLLYQKNLIETLIKSYKKYPYAVSARRVHRMNKKNGVLLPYNFWTFQYTKYKKPNFETVSTNGAGTLWPPHILNKDTFNAENIKNLCLEADDIYLKFMQLKNKVPVVWVKSWHSMPFLIFNGQQEALSTDNLDKNKNDVFIEKMQNYCKINLADYAHEISYHN